jgi:hypothetical protein
VDHYASLGVARSSKAAVIRAAYLALMRRYHPDRNPDPQAAERVRSLTAAYAVLGDETKRRAYDRTSEIAGNDRPATRPHHRRAGRLAFAVTTMSMAVLIWIVSNQLPPRMDAPLAPSASAALVGSAPPPQVDCAFADAGELVRNELIRRVSILRGGKRPTPGGWANSIYVRTSPALSVRPNAHFAECIAALSVAVPADVVMTNGAMNNEASALVGDADFSIVGDGARLSLIEFTPDARLIAGLASLQRLPDAAVAEPAPGVATSPALRDASGPPPIVATVKSPAPATALPKAAVAARMRPDPPRGGMAKEQSAARNLIALDQQLALFERQSFAAGDSRKRDQLRRGHDRFEASRARCATPACDQRLVLMRTREIAAIMASRPPAP